MAFKSPGIYFKEIDNTEYTNPAAEINTTVAIIGFAKKGPIGEPTEITSYNDFKSIFGAPINGTYAGLAVRSILSAGGTVLFVRIADVTLASESNVILKNGVSETDGALIINNKNAITVGSLINDSEFKNGTIYSSKIETSNGQSKEVVIRSPKSGRFAITDIMKQLSDGVKNDEAGWVEYSYRKPVKTNYRSFGAKIEGEDKVRGPYFVKLNANSSAETIINAINQTIDNGTTPFQLWKIYQPSETDEVTLKYSFKTKSDENSNVSENLEDAYFDISGLTDKGTKELTFDIKKEGEEKSSTIVVRVALDGNSLKIVDLVNSINESLETQNIGIVCKFVYNKSRYFDNKNGAGINSTASDPALLFFSTDQTAFEVLPHRDPTVNVADGEWAASKTFNKSLFIMTVNDETRKNFLNNAENDYWFALEGKIDSVDNSIIAFDLGTNDQIAQEEGKAKFSAEYIESTDSIKFSLSNVADVTGTKISIVDWQFGKDDNNEYIYDDFLFQRSFADYWAVPEEANKDTIDMDPNYKRILVEEKNALGSKVRYYVGQKALADENGPLVRVVRGEDQRIYIYQNGTVEIPSISRDSCEGQAEGQKTLFDLFGPDITEKQFDEAKRSVGKDSVIIKAPGNLKVDAEKNDMIIFTAREKGSGTSNVGIEIYTSVSPIDEVTKTHYIDVFVDGTKKETWEDVSYNKDNENYFVNLINADPDNGGSKYISAQVIQNSQEIEIKVPDTATLNSSGIVYLGTPINSSSISYANSSANSPKEYGKYDYMLGNDGKPTDGDNAKDLFMEAMDTETSGLANKDLYSWHILITPDDGQDEDVQNEAIKLCEFMEEGIYIADPPSGLSRDSVIKWHNGAFHRSTPLQSNYCCTYWPWLKVYNAIESKYQYVMPSIIMAAQFCKVDNSYAPWYAPAGQTNGYCSTALDLEVNSKDKRYPNKTDRDNLYLDQNRVNPFLKLRNGEILAYGEKTCQRKNSTLTKIHTRRMLIALKKDLNSVIKSYIFQPTMSENINKIKSNVTTIMEEYKAGGAIDSYVVDTSMNTTETLQQDILYIAISCVPVGCIEQVEITFTLNKSAE